MPEPGKFRQVMESRLAVFQEQYDKHKNDLVQPPAAYIEAKSAVFGIKIADAIGNVLPIFICAAETRPIHLDPRKVYGPPTLDDPIDIPKYTHQVKAASIDQLKQLVGVPADATQLTTKMRVASHASERWPVRTMDLPAVERFDFGKLARSERVAVHNMGLQILHGQIDAETIARPPYSAVADYLIERAKALPVFIGNDLVVCPGHSVSFSGYAAVYFNNVVVVGDGKIHLDNFTKLHSYQIRHS